jgi:hypothetical protein
MAAKKALLMFAGLLGFMIIFPVTSLVEMNLAPMLPGIIRQISLLSSL